MGKKGLGTSGKFDRSIAVRRPECAQAEKVCSILLGVQTR